MEYRRVGSGLLDGDDGRGEGAFAHAVILTPDSYARWTDGTPSEAKRLSVPYEGPLVIEQTDERWPR